jgi:hypothetical protein
MASSSNVGAYGRRWLVYVGAGTGTGGMFWRKRSPEEEKSKLVKQKKSSRSIVKGNKLTPRQQVFASSEGARRSSTSCVSA